VESFIRIRAYAVHALTASGAGLALLAMIFATGGHWEATFLCLGLALIVDGLDGPLAREFKVAELLPRWSGETLDLVVDFTTYVFTPAYLIAASGFLPAALSIPSGVLVVLTGAIYFADREMKTDDNYFRGFPAVWNLAAFYLYLFEPPGWLAITMIVALAVLSFAPVKFLHPLRVRQLRPLNVALLVIWALLAVFTLATGFEPGPYVKWPLAGIAIYFFCAGLLRRPV
jgi:phosphatidylcholine synthase